MIIEVSEEPAEACARFIAARLAIAVAERGSASLAVSGGSTAPSLFRALTDQEHPERGLSPEQWRSVDVFQVDERVAPDADADRNSNQLAALPARLHPMPVTAEDLTAAASEYAAELPDTFDVVHLGVGSDGHTASWVPSPHPDAERVLESAESVLTVGEYAGRDRMTLGRKVVNAARWRVVLAAGASKAEVIAAWVDGSEQRNRSWSDPRLPIAALDPDDTVIFLDRAAASHLDSDYVRER